MATFSVMQSASAGFGLIAKRPFSMIVLILFWAIVGVAPALYAASLALPGIIDAANAMKGHHETMDPEMVRQLQTLFGSMFALIGPLILWTIIVQSVLSAAVYRAVIEPQKSAFAYLRLGGDELRQFLASIILGLLFMVFYVGVIIAIVCLSMLGKAVGSPWQGWITALGIILAVCVFIWVLVRFSLALPATFGAKRIAIFDSWRLTKGRFWSLILTILLLAVFLIIVGMIGGAIRAGIVFGFGGHMGHGMDDLQNMRDMGAAFRRGPSAILSALGPAVIGALVLQILLQGLTRILVLAPFANAYVQLSGRDSDVHKEF